MSQLGASGLAPAARRVAPLRVVLGAALAYVAAALLALVLAVPPSHAAPLYPSAGLALVAVLVYGRPALLGVLLGALAIHLSLNWSRPLPGWQVGGLVLACTLGATLQAAVGAWLVRRQVSQPLVLAEPGDVMKFLLLGSVLACLVSASICTSALYLSGQLPANLVLNAWFTWWQGDTMGVLIGAPLALALVGRPRADWRPRLTLLGGPLLVSAALLTLGTLLVAHWDDQRRQSVFERDTAMATAGLQARLQHALDALEALRGLYVASDEVTASEFQSATEPWLRGDRQLQAMGFSQRVPMSELVAFEQQVLKDDGAPISVFSRAGAIGLKQGFDDMVVIRHVEPMALNRSARGVNAMSIAPAREAILAAMHLRAPVATAPFALTQLPNDPSGVVLYRALHGPPTAGRPVTSASGMSGTAPTSPDKALGPFAGVVFVTLSVPALVDSARAAAAPYLQWCLVDTVAARRMAGPVDCEGPVAKAVHRAGLAHQQAYQVGGRQWQLSLRADPTAVHDVGKGNTWLFVSVGLVATALLSALLLTVSGRTRRIQAAVDARTADLEREVAERQRTAGALLASEQRLRNLFDHVPAGIVFADPNGLVREANPRMCQMLGAPAADLIGQDLLATALPDDRDAIVEALGGLLRGDVPEVARQARLRHHDGSQRWVQTSWNVLRGSLGQPLWLVAVIEDITERLKRQEAEQGRQVAESANRAKSEFLSRMSHELRTPLNAMLGFAQLLELDRRPPVAPHQSKWLGQILQAGWHLLEMINDTLDLSRIEAGVMHLRTEPVALAPMVAQCTALVAQAAAAAGIQVQVALSADPAPAMLQADATRLKQVLTNLLSNAVKYNTPGGRVVLSSTPVAEGRISLQILDTGIGMSSDQLAQLYQPFNRLGREHSTTEGTGIGLVISQRLVELMGGTLQVLSRPGHGTTFIVTLPAAPPPDAAQKGLGTPKDQPARYHTRHVLCIEDNQRNAELVRQLLQARPQVQFALASTGHDGLAQARRAPPDLILLDMNLPDLDGLAVLAALKSERVCADIPVLALSADATPARTQAALDAGATGYLAKPLHLAELLRQLDELLAAADTRAGALLTPER